MLVVDIQANASSSSPITQIGVLVDKNTHGASSVKFVVAKTLQ
jgi:hypothetical protein